MDKNWHKLDKNLIWLAGLGLVFFLIYSYLAFSFIHSGGVEQKLIFNSPDETANYFFSRLFYSQSGMQFQDQANQPAVELVSPRSMRVINGQTIPAGFMGLSLIYGALAKIVSPAAIPFFTPLLAVMGVLFFYLLIKELFDKRTALLSSLLLYIFPGYWYYATKGLMPNVAFIALLIISLYFLSRLIKSRKLINYLLFGFFLGLALMVRTSEIVWIGLGVLIVLLTNIKKIKFAFFSQRLIGLWPMLFCFFAFLLAFSPIFYFNYQIYGSIFSYGYSLDLNLTQKNVIEQGLSLVQKLLLPFGFHPRLALKNIFNYTFGIFPLWSALLLIGLMIYALSAALLKRKKQLLGLLLYAALSGYLIIYYGSWLFHDNPDPAAITIGTSYVRYWLPIYIFALPFFSRSLLVVLKQSAAVKSAIIIFLMTVLILVSYQSVYLEKDEGIFSVKNNIIGYQNIAAGVLKQTEADAVIIADTMDKVFFPERRVVFQLNNHKDYARINKLITDGYPVYYFYFTRTDEDLEKFNQKYFINQGLRIGDSLLDFGQQSLYPVLLN